MPIKKHLIRISQSFTLELFLFVIMLTLAVDLAQSVDLMGPVTFSHIVFAVLVVILSPICDTISHRIKINERFSWSRKENVEEDSKVDYTEKDCYPEYIDDVKGKQRRR